MQSSCTGKAVDIRDGVRGDRGSPPPAVFRNGVPRQPRKFDDSTSSDNRTRRSSMRILQTMIRVRDLERSLQFYRDVLGMQKQKHKNKPKKIFTLAFVGYADESREAAFELTYN